MASITPNPAQTNEDMWSDANNYWSDAVRYQIGMLQTGFYHQGAEAANALEEAIDAELTAMYTGITAMKSMRNTQAAIRRLPPEVLMCIFFFCSIQEHSFRYNNRNRYDDEPSELWQGWEPGWMKVTYVCRYWRNAALQDPRLWGSNIACKLPFCWMEESSNHSKLVPASIEFQYRPHKSNKEVTHLLAKHLYHICHLALCAYDSDLSPVLQALVDRASVLETLKLVQSVESKSLELLPDDIFARYAPRLCQMCLVDLLLPLTICLDMISQLECLEMKISSTLKYNDNYHRSETCSPFGTFFSMLQHMSVLRTLKLTRLLPPCTAGIFTCNYLLSLPHLQSLTLYDGTAEIALFLEHLQIPVATRIEITAYQSTVDDIHLLLALQLCCHLEAAPLPLQAISVSCNSSRYDVAMNGHHGSSLLNATAQFCNALSVDAMSWLYCRLQPVAEWSRQQLVDFFTCFPVLEMLKISSSTGKHVVMVLASPIPGRKLSVNTTLLQQLRELTLKDFDFGPPHTKSRTAKTGKCEYIPLLEALRKRKAALGRIPKLIVTSCHMEEEWAKEMRREIELEWIPL